VEKGYFECKNDKRSSHNPIICSGPRPPPPPPLNINSAYTTCVGIKYHLKVKFFEDSEDLIQDIPLKKSISNRGSKRTCRESIEKF